jgi:hypothetical protein
MGSKPFTGSINGFNGNADEPNVGTHNEPSFNPTSGYNNSSPTSTALNVPSTDDYTGWNWEQILNGVLGFALPARNQVTDMRWTVTDSGTGQDNSLYMIFSETGIGKKTRFQVYLNPGILDPGGPWDEFYNTPANELATALSNGSSIPGVLDPRDFATTSAAVQGVQSLYAEAVVAFGILDLGLNSEASEFKGAAGEAFYQLIDNLNTNAESIYTQMMRGVDPGGTYAAQLGGSGQAASDFVVGLWNALVGWINQRLDWSPLGAIFQALLDGGVITSSGGGGGRGGGTGATYSLPNVLGLAESSFGDLLTDEGWLQVEAAAKDLWNAAVAANLDQVARPLVLNLAASFLNTASALQPLQPPGMNAIGANADPNVDGLNTPATGLNTPAAGLNTPAAALGGPDAGLNTPAAALGDPGAGIGDPGAGLNTPAAALGDPGAGIGDPGAGLNTPVAALASPDAGLNTPVAALGGPGGGLNTPVAALGDPGGGLNTPVAALGDPGAGLNTPVAALGGPGAGLNTPAAELNIPSDLNGQNPNAVGPVADQLGNPSALQNPLTANPNTLAAALGTTPAAVSALQDALGDSKAEQQQLKKALSLAPSSGPLHDTLTKALADAGKAGHAVEQALGGGTEPSSIQHALADNKAAQTELQRALAQAPKTGALHDELVSALGDTRQTGTALHHALSAAGVAAEPGRIGGGPTAGLGDLASLLRGGKGMVAGVGGGAGLSAGVGGAASMPGVGASGAAGLGGAAGAGDVGGLSSGLSGGASGAAAAAAPGQVGASQSVAGEGAVPFSTPMAGGGMGMGGGQGQPQERERTTWLSEDEDVWGTDPEATPGVLGRDLADDEEELDAYEDYAEPAAEPRRSQTRAWGR